MESSSGKWDNNWDGKGGGDGEAKKEAEAQSEVPTASRRLFFVRHGQQSSLNKRLTPLGRLQAALTGQRLKSLKLQLREIKCSTMKRAVETAEQIKTSFPTLELEKYDSLREGTPCLAEPPFPNWFPSEEEIAEDSERFDGVFKRIFYRADPSQKDSSHELIVAHSNLIRYLVCKALQFPPEAWSRFALAHGSITSLEILPNGNICLSSLGDAGHIPPEKVTY